MLAFSFPLLPLALLLNSALRVDARPLLSASVELGKLTESATDGVKDLVHKGWEGKGSKKGGPFDFTSTYRILAGPEQVYVQPFSCYSQ